MYYLNSRYYNPEWGRFINADAISGQTGQLLSHNMFAYCMNNPVNMIDESGFLPRWANIAIGVGIVGGLAVLTVATGGTGALALAAMGACSNTASAMLIGAAAGSAMGAAGGALGAYMGGGSKDDIIDAAAGGFAFGAFTGGLYGVVENGSLCFTEDTLIYTEEGYKPIKDIEIGDMVYSTNPDTGEKGLKQVKQVFINETSTLIHIYVDGEEIESTPEHPFYVEDKGWVTAGELSCGDKVQLYSGTYVKIKDIEIEMLYTPIKVYNFEVVDWHTYYVSTSNVLVHNAYHGNSKSSAKTHHGYEIYETSDGNVVKTGISGGKLNQDGSSRRANSQVNKWNKSEGTGKYASRVVQTNIPGRQSALNWERTNTTNLFNAGNVMFKHFIPSPY